MIFGEKIIPRLVIAAPLLAIVLLTSIITYFYLNILNVYFEQDSQRFIQEYVKGEKKQSEEWVRQLVTLFEYGNSKIPETIETDLKERVDIAYESAKFIYEKYRDISHEMTIKRQIEDALRRMVWQGNRHYIWITNYDGDKILSANPEFHGVNIANYTDADGRAVVLEEIQLVKRDGEGYLRSRISEDREQIIFVKNFGHYDWFFGSAIDIPDAREELKIRMLKLVSSIPTDASGFVALMNKEGVLYISDGAKQFLDAQSIERLKTTLKPFAQWHELEHSHANVYSDYFAPFGWHILYGFDTQRVSQGIQRQRVMLSDELKREMTLIVAFSVTVAILVAILSLLFSRRINQIFHSYKREVQAQQEKLRQLNESLGERVREEVERHQEKEKMLIQQSKMAAMGDMISMIAHQWRQPLNQMSYILMNIEGAFEHKELDQKYMNDKIREGTKLLEYMSRTIDDFRNFFRPDKAKVKCSVSEVVRQTLLLVKKSLSEKGIELIVVCDTDTMLNIYRNELMQVLLNLIKNASDALLDSKTEDPTILISADEKGGRVVIKVCDNGPGVSAKLEEKIFEPYFTTKEFTGGTGLGLYMSKSIIEGHMSGRLFLDKEEEHTCFAIVLPADLIDQEADE